MAITHDQALAFVAALLDSKPMRFHFEAILGFGKCPAKVTDFESQNSDTLDRCEELLAHISECVELLALQIRERPRQKELEFAAPGAEASPTRAKKASLRRRSHMTEEGEQDGT